MSRHSPAWWRAGRASVIALLAAAACRPTPAASPNAAPNAAPAGVYTNPVLDEDFPDPTVIRAADGWYYAYATQTIRGASDTFNIQASRSRDLVRWTRLPDALPVRPTWARTTWDFWAPHVSEHGGVYYLYFSARPDAARTDSTRGLCLAVATARRPDGPFTDSGRPLLCGSGFVNIDPMQLDDPQTGTPLLYWGSGFGPIKVQPLAADRLSFAPGTAPVPLVRTERGDSTSYQSLVEGAWVTYRAPWFYLFYSGDACCGPRAHYAVMVARARSAMGPFETLASATGQPQSVILARGDQWVAPGHNSVIRDARGEDWMFYHAIDPRQRTRAGSRDSRRVLLVDHIVYRDGWPSIDGGVPSTTPRPAPSAR